MISFRYAALALLVAAAPAMAQEVSVDYAPYLGSGSASNGLLALTDSLINDTGDNAVQFTVGYGFPGGTATPGDPGEFRALRYTTLASFKVPASRTTPFILTGMRINYRTQTVSAFNSAPPRVLYTSEDQPQFAVFRTDNTVNTRPYPQEDSTDVTNESTGGNAIGFGTLPLTTALGAPATQDGYRAPITESRRISFVPAGQTAVPQSFVFQPGETITIRVQYFNVPFPAQLEAGGPNVVNSDSTSLGCQVGFLCGDVNLLTYNGPNIADTGAVDGILDQWYIRALSDDSFYPNTAGEEGADNLAVALGQPYPNPARGMVDLMFSLRDGGRARMAVYDVTGRQVAVIEDRTFGSGGQTTQFDTSGLASGVYAIVLEANGQRATQRLSVVR